MSDTKLTAARIEARDEMIRALRESHAELLAALRDAQSGLRYIHQVYGPMPGVGWERVLSTAAITKAEAING